MTFMDVRCFIEVFAFSLNKKCTHFCNNIFTMSSKKPMVSVNWKTFFLFSHV